MALITFDDQGSLMGILRFGSEKYGSDLAAGVRVASSTWHNVAALESGCVLREVKAGPFDPNQLKDLAPWAPEEGSQAAEGCLQYLIFRISG
jgi:cupin fold WbuC family metalloprotein